MPRGGLAFTDTFRRVDHTPRTTAECLADPIYLAGVRRELMARGVAFTDEDVVRYLRERVERERSWPATEEA